MFLLRRWNRLCATLIVCLAAGAEAATNEPPRAVAIAITPPGGTGQSTVRLLIGPAPGETIAWTVSGGGSFDPDGDPLTYQWTCWDGDGNKCSFSVPLTTVNTTDVRGSFPEGTYNLTLTVRDPGGATATDTAQVKVIVDNVAPDVTPPADAIISATEAGGAKASASADLHDFLFEDASASDPLNLQFFFTMLPPQINGQDIGPDTLLPFGPSTVTFRFADAFNNVGAATAKVTVVDARRNDVFVGATRVVNSFGHVVLEVTRIRNGQAQLFCEGSQTGYSFISHNPGVLVDSLGRVVVLAQLYSGNSNFPHHGLFRCDFPGDVPRILGVYEGPGPMPGTHPIQFPGDNFGTTGGLHLARTRAIVVEGDNAEIVNEDSYVFAAERINPTTTQNQSLKSVRYRSLGGFSEEGPEPMQRNWGPGYSGPVAGMTNYKGTTYSAEPSGGVRRQSDPLRIHAEGEAFDTQFTVDLQLFGGIREMFAGAGTGTFEEIAQKSLVLNAAHVPGVPSGCPPPPPEVSPNRPGVLMSFFTGGDIVVSRDLGMVVNYDGIGTCSGSELTPNCGAGPYLAHVDQSLIDDDPNNDFRNRFQWPQIGCLVARSVPVRVMMPLVAPDTGFWNSSTKMVVGPQGLLGTQSSSGRVFLVPDSPQGVRDIVSAPIPNASGIAAFPPQNVAPSGLVIVIQINSPVDVLVTDAAGRRLGADSGTALNDFGENGHDTGAGSHPRFYVIRDAQPGTFNVSSIGTGEGPFEIHVFALNLDRTFGKHLRAAGNASPGRGGRHDFSLDAAGMITFLNSAPAADAGADQTVSAGRSGTATVTLDGSPSADPDGDALSFTWSGPFGVLHGAVVQPTLPAGTHLLTLTVDDGRGGIAEDTVIVTVEGSAVEDTTPPVITPTITGTSGANGWYVDDVTITWAVQDAESDVTSTTGCDVALMSAHTPGHTFTCSATSAGGVASESVTIRLDKTPPVVTCGAPDGTWHSADVSIGCTADGSISGLANPDDAVFNLTTSVPVNSETADASTTTRTVSDNAGNSTVVAPIAGNMVDKKAPAISIVQPENTNYVLNQTVTANYTCTDGGSGVASCAGPVASGAPVNTAVAGAASFTVKAVDHTNNAGSVTANYRVGYQAAGTMCHGAPGHQILSPIKADGTSTFRQRSTVPAKFRVCDANGVSIGTPGVVGSFSIVASIQGTVTTEVDEQVVSTTPHGAFRWDEAERQWIFNINNSGLQANTTYVFRIGLNDGTVIEFRYGVR